MIKWSNIDDVITYLSVLDELIKSSSHVSLLRVSSSQYLSSGISLIKGRPSFFRFFCSSTWRKGCLYSVISLIVLFFRVLPLPVFSKWRLWTRARGLWCFIRFFLTKSVPLGKKGEPGWVGAGSSRFDAGVRWAEGFFQKGRWPVMEHEHHHPHSAPTPPKTEPSCARLTRPSSLFLFLTSLLIQTILTNKAQKHPHISFSSPRSAKSLSFLYIITPVQP